MTAVSTRLLRRAAVSLADDLPASANLYGHVTRPGRWRKFEWTVTSGRNGPVIRRGRARKEEDAWTDATTAAYGAGLYERRPW